MKCLPGLLTAVTGLLLSTAATGHPGHTPPYASQITPANFHQAIRGPSAVAGIGDWMLGNGTLCASVSDPSHETYLSHRGGALVDLGFCGRDDDQWNTYHQLFNLSRDRILAGETVVAEQDEQTASLEIRGEINGVEHRTRYSLDTVHPDQLQIETRLTRVREGNRFFLFGALTLHPLRSLSPFSVSSTRPEYSKGFHHPFVDTKNPLAMLKVMFPDDIQVLVGPEHLSPLISYGIQSVSAEKIDTEGRIHRLREFAINDAEFTLMGNFVEPLWFDTEGQPGLLQFAQTPLMDLAIGETLVVKKRILVSPSTDVKHIVERLSPDAHVDSILPARQDTKAYATLDLPKKQIQQLIFKGINGTPDPVFFADALDFRVGDKNFVPDISGNRLSFADTDSDPRQISIPAGQYRVYAHRGPEYSVEIAEFSIAERQHQTLSIKAPERTVDTSGSIAADFHVHSQYSFDSTLPARTRLMEFVAQGGEVIVPSEHKRTVDFSPLIQEMGLTHRLACLTGVELTGMAHTPNIPRTIGHDNVFPVQADDQQFFGGTLPHENRRLGDVIAAYKARYPDSVFQLNHPRGDFALDADINFLNHLSIGKNFDPAKSLADNANRSLIEPLANGRYRDIDFDAIELLNGENFSTYSLVREDWFSLLRQGYRKTGTANSDSHNAGHIPALPRNYVHQENDSPDSFNRDDFIQAVHRGDLMGSTGPWLDVRLGYARMGETYDIQESSHQQSTLSVEIRTADWIPVDTLTIFINGAVVSAQAIPGAGHYEIPLRLPESGFVTVEVSGHPGDTYQTVYPGFYPFAFTNPVFFNPSP